jgi:hypothetical protein
MNGPQQKVLRAVLAQLAGLAVEQRISILRMGLGLMVQRQHDDEAWHAPQQKKEKESSDAARTN